MKMSEINVPGNGGNGAEKPVPLAVPGRLIRNANELISICAVIVVLILAFGALSVFNGSPPQWNTNSWQFLVPVVIGAAAVLGILLFAFLAATGERMMQDRVPHVLSPWSLRTLKAAGLPRDLSSRLQEILEQTTDQSTPPTGLTVVGRDRLPDTWITDLESTFGKSRVAEYEEMLFKYTARQTKS
jgi:uncharacterized integral membrane protein